MSARVHYKCQQLSTTDYTNLRNLLEICRYYDQVTKSSEDKP